MNHKNIEGIASLALAMVGLFSLIILWPLSIPFLCLSVVLGIDACKGEKKFYVNVYGALGAVVGALLLGAFLLLSFPIIVFGVWFVAIVVLELLFVLVLLSMMGKMDTVKHELHTYYQIVKLRYIELGKISLGLGIIGLAVSWVPFLGLLLDVFVFGPAAIILGVIAVWRGARVYGLIGILLGTFLILFWVIFGKEIYRGFT